MSMRTTDGDRHIDDKLDVFRDETPPDLTIRSIFNVRHIQTYKLQMCLPSGASDHVSNAPMLQSPWGLLGRPSLLGLPINL